MKRLHGLALGLTLIASTAIVTAQVARSGDDDLPDWLRHCERGEEHRGQGVSRLFVGRVHHDDLLLK